MGGRQEPLDGRESGKPPRLTPRGPPLHRNAGLAVQSGSHVADQAAVYTFFLLGPGLQKDITWHHSFDRCAGFYGFQFFAGI